VVGEAEGVAHHMAPLPVVAHHMALQLVVMSHMGPGGPLEEGCQKGARGPLVVVGSRRGAPLLAPLVGSRRGAPLLAPLVGSRRGAPLLAPLAGSRRGAPLLAPLVGSRRGAPKPLVGVRHMVAGALVSLPWEGCVPPVLSVAWWLWGVSWL
jgi:hypothetical protein